MADSGAGGDRPPCRHGQTFFRPYLPAASFREGKGPGPGRHSNRGPPTERVLTICGALSISCQAAGVQLKKALQKVLHPYAENLDPPPA